MTHSDNRRNADLMMTQDFFIFVRNNRLVPLRWAEPLNEKKCNPLILLGGNNHDERINGSDSQSCVMKDVNGGD